MGRPEIQSGVILAGGQGTRLGMPYNKHAALVYDRPMIQYPAEMLQKMGCESAVVVTNPESEKLLADCLSPLEMEIIFRHQTEPKGAADALYQARDVVRGNFPVLCGDVYISPKLAYRDEPTLFYNEFDGAQNHSVYDVETNFIIEKPARYIGHKAIIAYIYDERVFDVIEGLKPSPRGELELVDLHNYYLREGAPVIRHDGYFQDMGTPDGLLKVANQMRRLKI